MPVQVIPHKQDAHADDFDTSRFPPLSSTRTPAYAFDDSQFPPLSLTPATSRSANRRQQTKKLMLRYGQPPLNLMKLPFEIRECIYEAVMESEGLLEHEVRVRHFVNESHPQFPGFLPQLSHVSEAVRCEVAAVCLRKTRFVLGDITAFAFFTQFLESIPHNRGFKAVRNLTFEDFRWVRDVHTITGVNPDVALMCQCPGLKRVVLTRELRFAHRGGDPYVLKIYTERLEALGTWIEDVFKKRGQTVNVRVTW
jgi:hypothetical protein